MHPDSPLPDSSALEAGILEDAHPSHSSRLSRIQDNVRNLLRNSIVGGSSLPPSTPAQPEPANANGVGMPPTPPETPTRTPPLQHRPAQPEVLPSPTSSIPSTASPTSSTSSASLASPYANDPEAAPGITGGGLFPPPNYSTNKPPSPLARLSALFTSRAVDALNHPDISDPSLAVLAQQKAEKRQRRAWKLRRNGGAGSGAGRGKGKGESSGGSQCLLCVVAALMLASVVATYLIFATTLSTKITTTFHVLFILGIILATIVFAHTLIRLLLFSGSFRRGQQVLILPTHKHRHRRRHHHARRGDSLAVQTVRVLPGLFSDATEFVPATPIRVRVGTEEEVRPDSLDALPTATAATAVEPAEPWNQFSSPIANPPPAYGRWRGSVRANPDLLHWQAIPSPVDEDAQELPSPTYEEAMLAQRTGPPSYVTRDSPARTAGREDVRGSVLRRADAQERVAEPEMVEVVGHAGESVGVAK